MNFIDNYFDIPCILPSLQQFQILNINSILHATHNPLSDYEVNHLNNINTDVNFQNVKLIRYHIIPIFIFMNFFHKVNLFNNSLLMENINEISNIYIENENNSTLNYYSVSNKSIINLNIIKKFHNSKKTLKINVVNKEYIEYNELLFYTLLSWMPGNIYLAPSYDIRIDINQNNFDYNSKYILDDKLYSILFNLYKDILIYEENTNNIEILIQIFNTIKYLCKIPVLKFDSNKWNYYINDIIVIQYNSSTFVKEIKDFKIKIPDNNNLDFILEKINNTKNSQFDVMNIFDDFLNNIQIDQDYKQNFLNMYQSIINKYQKNLNNFFDIYLTKIFEIFNILYQTIENLDIKKLIDDKNLKSELNNLKNEFKYIYDSNISLKKNLYHKYKIPVFCEPNYLISLIPLTLQCMN